MSLLSSKRKCNASGLTEADVLFSLVSAGSNESREPYKAPSDVFVYTTGATAGPTPSRDPVLNILGTCYKCCEEGNIIVILYGCKYPVALRGVEGKIERYKMIEELYVHGVMSREGLEEAEDFQETSWEIV
jgi:hypothetical protein